MPEYRVSIIVEGEDRASGPLGRVGGALGGIGTIAGGILSAQLLTGIANGVLDIGRTALDAYANFERLGLSLQSLVAREMVTSGQAENVASALDLAGGRAKDLQGWIQKLAIESPFTQEGVAVAFRQAMAYGFTTDEAQRLTQAMIDFAAGSGASEDSMGRVALALGQVKAKGKLAGQEILQLTNAGLNVRDIISKYLGVTTAEFVKMQEKGLIPADVAIKAITESLETDFGGAAKRQATSFSGLISSLSDIKQVGLREFFTGAFEAAQPLMEKIVNVLSSPEFMANLNSMGQAVGDFLTPLITFLMDAKTGFENLSGIVASSPIGPAFASLGEFWTTQGPLITGIITTFGNTVGQIFTWLAETVIAWLVEKFNLITAWVNANGPLITAFSGVVFSAFTNIIGVIANMWQIVQPILDGLILIILDVAKFIMQVATGDWPGAWATIQNIVSEAWTAIKGFFKGFVNWVLQTFLGSDIKNFIDQWKKNFELLRIIVNEILDKVRDRFNGLKETISGVIGAVSSLIAYIKQISFPPIPAAFVRHSPSPIEQTFGNWLESAKGLKQTLGSMTFPDVGTLSAQSPQPSYDQRKEYHLHLSTLTSPSVVEQSFEIMKVLEYGT